MKPKPSQSKRNGILSSSCTLTPFFRIVLSIATNGADRQDMDVVALGMPKQEYDSEGRAKCPQKDDGSYPSTAADAVGVQNGKFLPSFPNAEGFGRWSAGGRFGAVLEVTKNTDDGSPGTLRWAMTQNVPRTVIVRLPSGTDGNIDLGDTIIIRSPHVTFAGQTASGTGLCVRKYKIGTESTLELNNPPVSHIILQHLRARVGRPEATRGTDSLEIKHADHVMVDHCSASWANDEQLSVMDSGRVTVQWCFIAEGLLLGNHNDNPGDNTNFNSDGIPRRHGMGTLARGAESFKSRYTFHHNYWACVKERMPRPGYSLDEANSSGLGAVIDVRNNVMFNWEGKYPSTNEDPDITARYNFVNNRYSPGLDSDRSQNDTKWYFMREKAPNATAFWSGNKWWDSFVNPQSSRIKLEDVGPSASGYFQSSAFEFETVTTEESNRATMALRIFNRGGTSFSRDSADQRVATDDNARVLTHSQAEVGGWPALPNQAPLQDTDGDGVPDSYEIAHQMNPKDAKDANLDPDVNGYSNLEEYIHSLFSIP